MIVKKLREKRFHNLRDNFKTLSLRGISFANKSWPTGTVGNVMNNYSFSRLEKAMEKTLLDLFSDYDTGKSMASGRMKLIMNVHFRNTITWINSLYLSFSLTI